MESKRIEKCSPYKRLLRRLLRSMLRSMVTVAKVTLVFLNIWVLAVVLVVSLGHWRVFDATETYRTYDHPHLVGVRGLKTDGRSANLSAPQPVPNAGVPPDAGNNPPVPAVHAGSVPPVDQKPPTAAPVKKLTAAEARVANLQQWCKQQHPHKVPYQQVATSKLTSILVDEKHKLLFCQIPGVALNDWRKILLILSGTVNATSTGSISGGDVFGKYAKIPKRLSDYDEKQRVEMLTKFYKVVFVRDPLERLVNAYKTKLVAKSSKYFHKVFGTQIITKYRVNAKDKDKKDGSDVKFSEFVKYIVDSEHSGSISLNEHWQQFYKQCHPCLVDYNFVGTYEDVEKDTEQVLVKLNANKKLKKPYVWDSKPLQEKELSKMYADVSATDLNNIYKIFSADYTLFGYKCPEYLHSLLKRGNVFHDY
ncbi:carbohydrate sulfotransferase 11-like isoform X2 [Physella acuta]|uniref:carbohydrate sulfotransferase 11-like isoform X2 n=1 Tax=Physella acuta TaxID=109671 RepID=UPI0027DE9619|nr:carbohydrate sulfotransferase 11-like isoform X2 [Physella acuta]